MAAFRLAAQQGAEMIELDLHLSADGVPVVIHDDTLERTTQGVGAVSAHTAAELAGLDAGHGFSAGRGRHFRGGGDGVPVLADVLAALPDVRFTLEVKTHDPALDAALRGVIDHAQAWERVLVAAHQGPLLRRLREAFPELPTNVAEDEVRDFLA